MSSVASNSAKFKWGDEAAKKFVRVPFELLVHFQDIELTNDDLPVILWIDMHQWGERPAFAHPAKLAVALKISEEEAVAKLFSLQERNFLILEKTKNNSRNYHQDLRPMRNKLRIFLKDNPDHCEKINRNDLKRIDTSNIKDVSTNRPIRRIDTSILPKDEGFNKLGDALNTDKYKGVK